MGCGNVKCSTASVASCFILVQQTSSVRAGTLRRRQQQQQQQVVTTG
jgi:hypothetical protein